jgi:hypothetical protein
MRLPRNISIDPGPPFIDFSWCEVVSVDSEKPMSINDLGFFLGDSHPKSLAGVVVWKLLHGRHLIPRPDHPQHQARGRTTAAQ